MSLDPLQMNLQEAYNLLAEDGISDNCRYFAEVYKCFNFTDTDLLADYIDFIVHEPVHWMEGFPAKLQSKMSFSKPKTAVIKLLKKKEVHDALGVEVAEAAHDVIWRTYKKESEAMIAKRLASKQRVVKGEEEEAEVDEATNNSAKITKVTETIHVQKAANPHMKTEEEVCETESIISSYESIPTPTLPSGNRAFQHIPHHVLVDRVGSTSQQQRIDLLKSALLAMASTLPDGVADAFRLLVASV